MQETRTVIETEDHHITFNDGYLRIKSNGFDGQVEYDSVESEIEENDPSEGLYHIVYGLNFFKDGDLVFSLSRFQDHKVTASVMSQNCNSLICVEIDERIFSEIWDRMT